MEVSKEPAYRVNKAYLYPACKAKGAAMEPCGSIELVVSGLKGQLTCRTSQDLGRAMAANPEMKFYLILQKKSSNDKLLTGDITVDSLGCGYYSWDFNVSAPGTERQGSGPVDYRVQIGVEKTSGMAAESGGVLMLAEFSLPFEIRDSRIVGFKKEATVKRPGRTAYEKNPLIQQVEPFQPPIPNSIWWRISIQPDFRNYRQTEFCPRQKSYKAVF